MTGVWPFYDADEREAVAGVLASGRVNYWTGDEGRHFEREYAAALGREHAIVLHNGSLALELALMALGVGPGDEVVTTPRTFIASASAAVMRGATPVFADVDRDSGNLTVETVEPVLSERTKAIVAVHLAGWPVDMAPLMNLARSRGIAVIEDASQAHGATIDGTPVGAFGDLAAFSFCQDKIITTGGEGGLLALDDEAMWRDAWAYKDHGKSYEAIYERPDDGVGYKRVYESFGTNWRMTEMQAAIGRIQLRKLPEWHARRHAIGTRYEEALRGMEAFRVPVVPEAMRHAYYRAYVYVRPEALRDGWSRDRILAEVREAGVPIFTGSASELYLEKAFRDAHLGPPEALPVAKELGETSLALLCHPTLEDADVERTVEVLRDV
ncbi:MAG: DegT/DnrJ/EryC1/StrS aminotransferase family protein, partial [Trueperaceae bacterium]|nr:DegT/DnrJ/EryC1/StrS aminotransferase family protein [Trueperaceae bacterium]